MKLLHAALAAAAIVAHANAQAIAITKCSPTEPRQQWMLQPGKSGQVQAADSGGLCLSTAYCNATVASEDVLLSPCGDARCGGNADQQWQLDASTGFLYASALSPKNQKMCLTLAAVTGPGVNLWPCDAGSNNTQWVYQGGQLVSKQGPAYGCLQRMLQPGDVLVVNSSIVGRVWDGVGGLAAIGGARLLYEYPEPQRSDILDLMFSPNTGAGFSILKTEIEGDVDSSYGSGPSFQHTADKGSRSFNRGIYLPWLVGEAKKRNPNITLYSLSWGVPHWVGNGVYYSADNIDYHVNYLVGAREYWNATYDYTGVFNERAFNASWVKELRAAMDAAGLNSTQIVLNDQGDSGSCIDCPSNANSLHDALTNDAALRRAVGAIGFHSGDVEGLSPMPCDWEEWGMKYFQSESNILDGFMPQWIPIPGNPYGSGLSWPRVFLANYIRARATATVLCPLMHAWTWQYGRENHGLAQTVSPWDGYYELGSAFWSQAHFGQFAAPGWHFLDGDASGQFCSGGTGGTCYVLWGTLVSPAPAGQEDVSIIVVSTADTPTPLTYQFVGSLARLAGSSMAVWSTTETAYFQQQADAAVDSSGYLNVTLAPRSVYTISTVRTANHAVRPVPSRAPFPLPYSWNFDTQRLESPGRILSDLFGAFEVQLNPTGAGQVLQQAVPANPGANGSSTAWMRNGIPYTSLPAGTNGVNINASIDVLITATDINSGVSALNMLYLCGRTPIWQPAAFTSASYSLGICLAVLSPDGGVTWSWQLQDNTESDSKVLASGALTAAAVIGQWHTLQLVFEDDSVMPWLDGTALLPQPATGLRCAAGVVGFGTAWHTGWFDNLQLAPTTGHGRTPGSYLYDLIPAERVLSNITGWAGLALDLTPMPACDPNPTVNNGSQALTVTGLGRFRTAGNSGKHAMNIFRASDGASMLPGGTSVTVDMSAAGCTGGAGGGAGGSGTDWLGFCYASLPSPVTLPPTDTYYIVSQETAGGDAVREMYNPARGTTHVNRDGSTLLSTAGPNKGCIAGRVMQPQGSGSWSVVPELDTSYGPVNMLLAE